MTLEVLGALETPRTVYTGISLCSRRVVALDLPALDSIVIGVVTGVRRCHYGGSVGSQGEVWRAWRGATTPTARMRNL
jgi:hypothetical protein